MRECPSGVSGTSPPYTAALRIRACCAPSHPFGCVKTNRVSASTDCHNSDPPACAWVSCMYVRVHWWMYLKKSPKTASTDLPGGNAGRSPSSSRAPFGGLVSLGRRCSLNLCKGHQERTQGCTRRYIKIKYHSTLIQPPSLASSALLSDKASAPTARTDPRESYSMTDGIFASPPTLSCAG